MGATNSRPMTSQDETILIRAAKVSRRSTRELVEAGINGNESFIEKFRDYRWWDTLDINMVAIWAVFLSYFLGQEDTKSDAKQLLNCEVIVEGAQKTLFQLLIDGNGKAIESNFKNNLYCNQLLDKVWKNQNDSRRTKFWARVKRISFWIVSKKRAKEIAKAIEKLDNEVEIPSKPEPKPEPKPKGARLHLGRYVPDAAKEEFNESEDIEASRHTDVAEFLVAANVQLIPSLAKKLIFLFFEVELTEKNKYYSEIPFKKLIAICNCKEFQNLKKVLDSKGKISVDFLDSLKDIASRNQGENKIIDTVCSEKESILGPFTESESYKEVVEKFKKQFSSGKSEGILKSTYFDRAKFNYHYELVKRILERVKYEIKKRKKPYLNHINRDDLYYSGMKERMDRMFEGGDFLRGDDVIRKYTEDGEGFKGYNSAARHIVHPVGLRQQKPDWQKNEVWEDDYFRSVLEVSEIRKRIKEEAEQKGGGKTLADRLNQKELYRAVPLYDFLKTIRSPYKPPKKDWYLYVESKRTNTNIFIGFKKDKFNDIKEYLEKAKISIDPAVLSTSKKLHSIYNFVWVDLLYARGAILYIDVSNFKYGMDITDLSNFGYENEVILAPGTRLEITGVEIPEKVIDNYPPICGSYEKLREEDEKVKAFQEGIIGPKYLWIIHCKAIDPKPKTTS